jgi:hypothetical protein
VIVDFPTVADLLTFSVNVLVEVAFAGLNDAFTPLGSPLALRATLPAKPFVGLIVIVLVPLLPSATVTAFGDAVSVKFPVDDFVTVSLIVVLAVRLPDVPVIVTVVVPAAAVALASSVRVLLEAVGLALNDAVTPAGSPLALRVALPAKPPAGLIVIALVVLPPAATVSVFGAAVSVKLPTDDSLTASAIVVLAVRLPDVPVIVTIAVPVAAVALAFRVNVLVEVVGFGLNVAVTPLGSPDAASVTLPLNPFSAVTVMALVPLPPCTIDTLVGEATKAKPLSPPGQLLARLAAFTVPIPVAKSQPVVVP